MVADHFVLVHHVVVFAFEALDLTLSVNALVLLIILAELESVLAEEMAAKFYLRVEFDVGAERALVQAAVGPVGRVYKQFCTEADLSCAE